MPDRMFVRDADGGEWRPYRGELRPDGQVAFVPAPATRFVVGADLGQVVDYTALSVVESHRVNPGDTGQPLYAHEVTWLERYRGEPYPKIAARIAQLCAELPAPP